MKILQIHNFYQIYGGEDSVVTSEKGMLESKGHKVVQYSRHNEEFKKYSLFQKITFFFTALYSFRTARELDKLLDKEKFDIAHVHNVFPLISPSVYYCLKRHKVPVAQTIHNYRFLCPNGLFFIRGNICEKCKHGNTLPCIINRCYKNSFLLSMLYAFIMWSHKTVKTFRNNIDVFITLSRFTKNKLVSGGYPKDRIEIEGNFLFDSKGRTDYGHHIRGEYVIYVGRLSEEKGLETLLKAYHKADTTDIDLKILGCGMLEGKLKQYVKRNNIEGVEFMGYVSGDEKLQLLRNARFSFVTSECYENFGLTILESFVVGTPVVASRIGGIAELVDDGKSGLLFEPGNVDDLAEKLVSLYKNPDLAMKMGEFAHNFINKFHSMGSHYKKIMRIYERTIDVSKKGFQL